MTLFLDTEFNGYGGQLISLALVSDVNGREFYGVLPLPSVVHPWVAQNVVPLLNQEPEPENEFRFRLANYLMHHRGEDIVADWPEDFVHLLRMITMPGGERVAVDFNMRLVSGMDCMPHTPHNALSDAWALERAFKEKTRAA